MNLGEKIKQLRKARKMTLVQVAGDKLSKGMLSLIENGKAQPSMESLQHIAKQLGIDVSELMQTKDIAELKALYVKVEKLTTQLSKIYEEEEHRKKSEEIYQLLEPYMVENKLLNNTFEEIRLTEIYHLMRHFLDIALDIQALEQCVMRYKQIQAYSKVIMGYQRLGGLEFERQEYAKSIEWMLKGIHYIEQCGDFIGDIEKLDLYYNLTVVYAAQNNEEQSERYLQYALKIAQEKKILYRANDFYRYLFFIHVMKGDGEKAKYYLTKIQALSIILEDPLDIVVENLLQLTYWNMIEKAYEKVITMPFDYKGFKGTAKMQIVEFVQGEVAFAHYHLGEIEQAFRLLQDIQGPKIHHHPADATRLYRSFAVRALSYYEMNDIENAKRDILYAANGVKNYAPSIDKAFIDDSYEKIM